MTEKEQNNRFIILIVNFGFVVLKFVVQQWPNLLQKSVADKLVRLLTCLKIKPVLGGLFAFWFSVEAEIRLIIDLSQSVKICHSL